MALKVQRTLVEETEKGFRVEMLLGTDPTFEGARTAIQLRVALEGLEQYPHLAELQRVALERARKELDDEIHRLQSAKGRSP